MKGRAIFWTVAMAYTGFLLTGQGLRTFHSLSITEALLGALTGFLLAIMSLSERGGDKDLPSLLIPLNNCLRTGAYPAKTAAQIRSQSFDPNRQAEFVLLVLKQVRVPKSQLTF